jgi:hypothetical protein
MTCGTQPIGLRCPRCDTDVTDDPSNIFEIIYRTMSYCLACVSCFCCKAEFLAELSRQKPQWKCRVLV